MQYRVHSSIWSRLRDTGSWCYSAVQNLSLRGLLLNIESPEIATLSEAASTVETSERDGRISSPPFLRARARAAGRACSPAAAFRPNNLLVSFFEVALLVGRNWNSSPRRAAQSRVPEWQSDLKAVRSLVDPARSHIFQFPGSLGISSSSF